MTNTTQLYLITPPALPDMDAFCEELRAALDGGNVACVQLRLKAGRTADAPAVSDDDILHAAEKMLPITAAADAELLINDRPDLAKKTGANGVHLGQNDASYDDARALLGDEASIGVTCHNSIHLALVAGEQGADYVAFGAFFPTTTKETEYEAKPDLISWWVHATTVPCVAIGGITPQNCAPLIKAQADFLAVSSAVWAHPNGAGAAVQAFNAAIAENC